jgi:hypothetical protein
MNFGHRAAESRHQQQMTIMMEVHDMPVLIAAG